MKTWKNISLCIVVATLAFIVSGCAYLHIQRPLDTDFDATQLGMKEGRSNSYSILWIIAWGNAGTKAAAEQGGIKTIRHADTEIKSVFFGVYSRITTIIYGD